MISITKVEAAAIREKVPMAHIVRTMKQRSKRHHYFCEETRAVMAVLKPMRGIDEPKRTRRRKGSGNRRGRFNPKNKRVAA